MPPKILFRREGKVSKDEKENEFSRSLELLLLHQKKKKKMEVESGQKN